MAGAGRSWLEMSRCLTDQIEPRIHEKRRVLKTPYSEVFQVTAEFANATKTYFVNECGARAGLLVMDEGRVLLTRQYRLLVDSVSWELPGGRVEENESPEAGAIRECCEETGIRALNVQPLLSFQMDLDTLLNPVHFFRSDAFEQDGVAGHETCGHDWVPLGECLRMVFDGRIQDSFSIVGLLACQVLRSPERSQAVRQELTQCR